MKWIKTRKRFLNEAIIRDVISPRQAQMVAKLWGERYLDYKQIDPTEKIIQGRWKLSEEDKRKVLGAFFTADLDKVYKVFENLPDNFVEAINESVDLNLLKSEPKWEKILNFFDIKKPTINQISVLMDPIFRKISVSETMSSEMILKDENGRPILGEDNRPQKVAKEPGKIIYSKNLVNINTFVEDFNRCFPDTKIVAEDFFSGDIARLVSKSKEDFSGEGYQVEVDVYGRDMYLSIQHNPKDILNMSISRFYSSCQNLYSGGYRENVLGNVFDPNSVPAFLLFDSSIHDEHGEHISDTLPVSRMIIRNIETFGEDKTTKLFFDRAYPDRMKVLFAKLVTKYSKNVQNFDQSSGIYLFTPDLPIEDAETIRVPYMDRLGIERARFIGVNAQKIYFGVDTNWSKTLISPKAEVKELTIETEQLPQNFFDLQLNPDWIRFKFLKINSAEPFKKIKTSSLAFDKCQFENSTLISFIKSFENVNKLQLVNCKIGDLDFSEVGTIDELHLIYNKINPNDLPKIIEQVKCKKLVLSGDLVAKNKALINSLKSKGLKIEIIGPQ